MKILQAREGFRTVQAVVELARRVAERLAEIEGVEAVALGGSWARGEGRSGSDVDIGIYYRNEHRPSVERLRRLAEELGYRQLGQPLTHFGGWGAWINGGAWLMVEGTPVDWIYRELGLVRRIVEECKAGRPAIHYQPGHPHGFHTHIYMGEVHYCRPLYDPDGTLGALKGITEDYPPRLKQALIRSQLWEARFALDTCRGAARGDTFYVAGSLFRCAACLVQPLFALNERYVINEKGAVEATRSLAAHPADFTETVHSMLAGSGESPERLENSIGRFERLLVAVEKLCAG